MPGERDRVMSQPIVIVDAFTDRPFAGNPAAVCVLRAPRDDRWMQLVAREMNLSETAFLYWEGEPGTFRLRWFTPAVEVDLCGHATLASAHALWTEGFLSSDVPARFRTRSGLLTAERRDGWIELDFPATPPGAACPAWGRGFPSDPAGPPADAMEWASVVGVPVVAAAFSKYDLLVELASEDAVRSLRPDITRLAAAPVRGVIVTARATTAGADFVSRFFAPRAGVDEDPVCGSAHCCLGPYWGERLGKTDLVALQVSPRGGTLRIGLRGPRVRLAGKAVTTVRGHLSDVTLADPPYAV
jgi:PhzF family phenazine biosynthesis protein